ncbi:MAG TPA: hypothetical protein VN038_04180, partial [Dyadobacter sp.]|nr:hypothetical protein [Dyadobacter sp.]
MKETEDSDDPLARTRTVIYFPQKSTQTTLAGVLIPVDFLAPYDFILVIFLLTISLFLSGIRAAYAASGAMENPWERKAEGDNQLPTRVQQLALSLVQRGLTLFALLLAARLAWLHMQAGSVEMVRWAVLAFLVIWIWLDAMVRYNSARKAQEFIPKISGLTQFLIKICKPLTQPIMKLGYAFGVLTPQGGEITTEMLEAKAESEEETDLLRGLANFRQTNARKAMQAR